MSFFKQFENSIDIDRSDENLFSMTPSKDYFVGNTPHGGYLTAVMQKAISLSMPHPHVINSNTLYLDRTCLLYTSPSPRDGCRSRMPSSA